MSRTVVTALHRPSLQSYSFAKTITQFIGRDYEQDLPRYIAVGLLFEVGPHFFEARCLYFRKHRFDIIDLKEASILLGITPVFGEANLDAIAGKDGRQRVCLLSGNHPKTEDGFVER